MQMIKHKIKQIATILKNDAIIILMKNDSMVVDASNKNPDEVKKIAANFFKEAYNIKQ